MNASHFLTTTQPWVFRDESGTPFRGIGLNLCWESRDRDDSAWFGRLHEERRFSYSEMIPRLATLGVNYIRVWMVYWNLPVDWPRPANNRRYGAAPEGSRFHPEGLAALLRLLSLCETHGLKLMLCLETHVGFLGEGWALNPYNSANGGPARTPVEFFTSEAARAKYREKLRCLVETIGDSPALGSWEFFNEVDNLSYDSTFGQEPGHPSIAAWHREMGDYLRTIDSHRRPVTTSISHREIPGLWEAGMDFNQHHMYCNTSKIPEALGEVSARTRAPHVIGEFGRHWDWSLDFRTLEPEFSTDLVRGLWLGLFSPTPIVPLTWWWEYFEAAGLWPVFLGLREVSDAMLEAGQGEFEPWQPSSTEGWTSLGVTTGEQRWLLQLRNEGSRETEPRAPDPRAKRWNVLEGLPRPLRDTIGLAVYSW